MQNAHHFSICSYYNLIPIQENAMTFEKEKKAHEINTEKRK